jgi:hypothetical protein
LDISAAVGSPGKLGRGSARAGERERESWWRYENGHEHSMRDRGKRVKKYRAWFSLDDCSESILFLEAVLKPKPMSLSYLIYMCIYPPRTPSEYSAEKTIPILTPSHPMHMRMRKPIAVNETDQNGKKRR